MALLTIKDNIITAGMRQPSAPGHSRRFDPVLTTSGFLPTPDMSLHLGSFTPCCLIVQSRCFSHFVLGTPSTAIPSGLPVALGPAILARMGTKSRETIYGASIRAAAERATEARKEADRLACDAWNKRMLGFQGPAQPSPTLGDAINAGYGYLEVKMPWLRHPSNRCPRHRTAIEGNADPRTRTIHALQGLLGGSCTRSREFQIIGNSTE